MGQTSVNYCVLLARLAQIILGLLVFGFSTVIGTSQDSIVLAVASIPLGANVALLGLFGLFGLWRRPDDDGQVRLFALLLFIDCWALAFSIAGGVCLSLGTQVYDWWGQIATGKFIAPAVASFVSTFIISALIGRTLRLWWKRTLFTARPSSAAKFNTWDYEAGYAYSHTPPKEYVPIHVKTGTAAPNNVEEVKTPFSSRPQSFLSGTDTITHPNIAYVTQSNLPSRAVSQNTTSYPTRVEVGSKVERV